MASPLYESQVETLTGIRKDLSEYRGKVLLIVNTASRCGFTPQYEGLEGLYRRHRDEGLAVLGFPCNQFGRQEPGSEQEIADFCTKNYGVSFPMHAKVEVNGSSAHPLFQHLKHQAPGLLWSQAIKWNFTKFLVNRRGEVVERYAPSTKPDTIEERVVELLAEPAPGAH